MPQKIIRIPVNGVMTDIPFPPVDNTKEEKYAILTSQIQALTERNEFLEDLIAELAVQAYSKSPSA